MQILDIDLDFFQDGRFMFLADDEGKRVSAEEARPWKKEKVITFLENNCGLKMQQKIKGKIFTHHHEVFYELRELIKRCKLKIPFELNHIDAHADLGMGDASWAYIMGELIHKPLIERSDPKQECYYGLGFTNYLSFAIANRWIKELNFIINEQWHDDIPRSFLAEDDIPSIIPFGRYNFTIQLKKYTEAQIDLVHQQKCEPIGYEP